MMRQDALMSPRFDTHSWNWRLVLATALPVAAGCVLLLGTIATISRHSGRSVADQADPTLSFDLRFPEPFDRRFLAKSQSAPKLLGEPVGRGGAPPAALPNARTLRRVMDLGVAQYATGADDSVRAKGASLVLLAALLGFAPAQALVVRNYPRSSVVQSVVPMQDAVRFAIDLLTGDATEGDPPRAVEEPAIALGSYFARRGEMLLFAKHLLDAIADEKRAQTDQQMARLLSIFARIPGTCSGLKRAISQDRTLDQNECSEDLHAALLRTVRSRSPIGLEAEGRNRALQMLKETDGIDR
jgi:hypothetical protein